MLFNSYEFIFIFLPISLFIYFYLNSQKLIVGAKAFLIFASLSFYSYWDISYLPLILTSMFVNYTIARVLSKRDIDFRKIILFLGVSFNLAMLGYFKYADFFIENFNSLFNGELPMLYLTLPLAISFFTFQQIAFLVDSYRGETTEIDILNYALFVTFFPQLIAGPIVHHKEMMPQFAKLRIKFINYRNISIGLFIFAIGLFKKVVIADSFATWATNGFDIMPTLTLYQAWATSLSYTFQLYFDFSGYTDMAIGIALMFNIALPINFNSPYKALDIQDFWRRWHITLSRFLRDYIYIPLGGNRRGEFKTYSNLMVTFLLGGIWHGAGWTFLFWGFLHGVALIVHRFWQKFNIKLPMIVAWFITFNFINITWIFFRAKDFEDALKVLNAMFNFSNIDSLSSIITLALDSKIYFVIDMVVFIPAIVALSMKNSIELSKLYRPNLKYQLYSAILLTFGVISLNRASEFLYFNF